MAEQKTRTGLFSRTRTEPPQPLQPPVQQRRDPSKCIVDCGIYVDGKRIATPKTFDEAFKYLEENEECFAWLGLFQPGSYEMGILATEFKLNPLAVEDTIVAHQRPKLERYEDTLFLVLRAASYEDRSESVNFGEIHAFVGERFVITVRHSQTPNLTRVRADLESHPDKLAQGSSIVLMRLLDIVVDDYMPVVYGIDNDIDEIDAQVFTGLDGVSKRIYQLTREVIDFQRAVRPIGGVINSLRNDRVFYFADDVMRQQLRDIEDHITQINERIDSMREALVSVLNLHLALQAQKSNERMQDMSEAALRQAEDSRRIAAWAGVIFIPSLITGIYGMNFQNMPELHWVYGYPVALVLMLISAIAMYIIFKYQEWL